MMKSCMFHYRKQTKIGEEILLWNSKWVRAEMSLTLSAVKTFQKSYPKLSKCFKNLNTGHSETLVSHLHQQLGRILLGLFKVYILEICCLYWHWYLNPPTDLLSWLELNQDRNYIRSKLLIILSCSMFLCGYRPPKDSRKN